MKKIIYIILASAALLLTNACERVGTIYQIADGSACVSFPSEDAIFEMLASDGNKITVELWRGNTKGAKSVAVEIEDGTGGVFTPSKTSFDFADGEGVATIDFTYPDINDFGGEVYEILLTVADPNQVSPAGIDEMKIQAQRKLTRVKLGTGVFYSSWFEESWKQDIYTTVEAPNYYILPNCWVKGTDWTFTMVNGVPTWPAAFYSGSDYNDIASYPLWIQSGASEIKDGILYLDATYYIPSVYVFGDGFEAFKLPEGVTLQ